MLNIQTEIKNQSQLNPEIQDLRVDTHELSVQFKENHQDLFNEWSELLKRDQKSTILENPEMILKDLGSPEQWGNLVPQLMLAYQGRQLIACAVIIPKYIRSGHFRGWNGKSHVLGYRLAGNQISGDKSEEVQNVLFQTILNHLQNSHAQFLLIDDLEANSALDCIRRQPAHRDIKSISPTGLQDHHWLKFPNSIDDYWGEFKSKTRNTLRRKIKKMGDIEFVQITDPEQIPEFLVQANEVSINTWQSQELGLRVQNDEEEKRFLTFLAKQGWLRAYLLKKDSQPVAFIIGTQFNGTYYLDELGFDRQYSRLSPGTVLFNLLVNDLFENDIPTVLDFGLGDAEYKKLFGNQLSQSQLLYLLPPGWKSSLNYLKFHSYSVLKSGVKKMFNQFGAWKNIRRRIKDRVVQKKRN